MKKTILCASLMLLTLCFVGCQKSEPNDLRLFELKGNVESIKILTTYHVTPQGKKTRKSFRNEQSFRFDKNGSLLAGYDCNQSPYTIERDKNGNIETIYTEWTDGPCAACYTYKWNKDGYPIERKSSCDDCEYKYTEYLLEDGYTASIIYDDSCNHIMNIETASYECGIHKIYSSYKILKTDAHGNWIKRIVVSITEYIPFEGMDCVMYIDDGIFFSVEERVITYYKGNDSSQNTAPIITTDNTWIYGTWKCRTPYGTIKVILQEDGRMYDSVNEGWYKYTIEGNRIIEQCNGYISTYNIDRANERFDCGEPDVWFYKE